MKLPFEDAIEKARELLYGLRTAYRTAFSGRSGKLVLQDLAKFCRANESTFHPEQAIANRLDGRREVWLRIQKYMNLTDEEVWRLTNTPEE